LKKVLLTLGVVLSLPMIVLLINLYWWFMTDTWLFSMAMSGDKVALTFIFVGLGISLFTTASVIETEEKK
jgi:hypothetical protein